ncbi:TPA: DUF4435 domain-containing protein [Vibrio cholerae]
MIGISSGSGFPIGSDYIGALNCFRNEASILVYVEGFEDVSFWNKIFRSANISVSIQAFGNSNKANGKASIIKAWENGEIKLGKNLIIALDSDYDYLLDRNEVLFSDDFVFQTYAFSIENLLWHPEYVGVICQDACNNSKYINPSIIRDGIKNWSKTVYPEFLRFLASNANDDEIFSKIMDVLDPNDLSFSYNDISFPLFSEKDFQEKMYKKGLNFENVHLFIRGHDFASKINNLCRNIINEASAKVKYELQQNHKDNASQFISEFYNKRCEPDAVARGKDIKCSFAIPKILDDIIKFKENHHESDTSSFVRIVK